MAGTLWQLFELKQLHACIHVLVYQICISVVGALVCQVYQCMRQVPQVQCTSALGASLHHWHRWMHLMHWLHQVIGFISASSASVHWVHQYISVSGLSVHQAHQCISTSGASGLSVRQVHQSLQKKVDFPAHSEPGRIHDICKCTFPDLHIKLPVQGPHMTMHMNCHSGQVERRVHSGRQETPAHVLPRWTGGVP